MNNWTIERLEKAYRLSIDELVGQADEKEAWVSRKSLPRGSDLDWELMTGILDPERIELLSEGALPWLSCPEDGGKQHISSIRRRCQMEDLDIVSSALCVAVGLAGVAIISKAIWNLKKHMDELDNLYFRLGRLEARVERLEEGAG